ncbi:distal membrane-arm assembly complex protein 2 [Anthonomus grandis grandis]|uniref:distal membrane-arm assembly complex protein 2 n=1 Tax=Anthonomus grandis grandis TaxID=2921223 RepID=UPI00216540EF|nr:distal membrane-arm assembly complex protein 2 [Anthonomus grandis grandis]
MLKILQPGRPKRLGGLLSECLCRYSSDNTDKKPPGSGENRGQAVLVKTPPGEKAPKKPADFTKEDLQWRKPWHEKQFQYYDTLRTFYSEDNNASTLAWIQQPINLSPKAIKKWWARKKDFEERFMQQYIPERHNILGPELAAAHFIVYRGGAVKFHDENKWIKAIDGHYELPDRYKKGMHLQAIDCTDMNLRYEGLDNLRNLKNLEWLSFNSCKHIDDWCLDVITNVFSHSLLYLDLRNCFKVTERGLGAVYKMPHLKVLYLDDLLKDTRYEMTCLLLEELNPQLTIKSDVIDFEIK